MDIADWKGLRTKMIWALGVTFLSGLGYLIYPIGYTIQLDVTELKEYIIEHEAFVKDIVAGVTAERALTEDKLGQLLEYHKRDFHLTGTGSVGTFGGDESYVRVNRRSTATVYKDGDRMLIKCIDVEGKPEAVLIVNGTFSNGNTDILISFSSEAAEDLGISGRVEVEMEPAEQ